jgi:glycosyltransferase involved in cell wall biosynthesis
MGTNRLRRLRRRHDRRPTLSVVVPTLNEADNLEVVLPELQEVLDEIPGEHEVILVDGGSVDATVETAQRLLPDVEVVEQARTGKGNAVAAGIEQASNDIVVMFDADGSADPAEIPQFVEALVDGADFAKGSRFTDGGGSSDITPMRHAGNAMLNKLANGAFGTDFTDLCYGYNAFWTDMSPVLDLPDAEAPAPDGSDMVWGDGFEIETLINCRMAAAEAEIAEVPSVERDRIHGSSNLNAVRDGFRVLRTILVERFRRPAGRLVSRQKASAPIVAPSTEGA